MPCDGSLTNLKSLPAPQRAKPSGKQEAEYLAAGEAGFKAVGCATCHTQDFGNAKGLYSDLLLHRMGIEVPGGGFSYGTRVIIVDCSVPPPSDAEAAELVGAFLRARVTGQDAEEFLHPNAEHVVAQACSLNTTASCAEIPLLYATTSGTPYERFEFEAVRGPVWPGGWIEFSVRLFAEGDTTVVEQPFFVDRTPDDRLGLVYGSLADADVQTTENGEVLGLPWHLLDGEVTFRAAQAWYEFFDYGADTIALVNTDSDVDLSILADPVPVATGCEPGPVAADAASLVQSIRSDPDLEATEPVAVSIGQIEALRIDVVAAAGADACESEGTNLVVRDPEGGMGLGPGLGREDRMRLYVLDLPDGSPAHTLAIAIVAPDAGFETVLEETEPILDSFEFPTR
jgi:hypothetical protein